MTREHALSVVLERITEAEAQYRARVAKIDGQMADLEAQRMDVERRRHQAWRLARELEAEILADRAEVA